MLARPRTVESCRGDNPWAVVVDEIAFTKKDWFYRFLQPLTQVRSRRFTYITTPPLEGTWFTEVVDMVKRANAEGDFHFSTSGRGRATAADQSPTPRTQIILPTSLFSCGKNTKPEKILTPNPNRPSKNTSHTHSHARNASTQASHKDASTSTASIRAPRPPPPAASTPSLTQLQKASETSRLGSPS